MEGKTIRNPSEEEIKNLQRKDATVAKPKSKNKVKNINKENMFEPEAVEFDLPSGSLIIPGGKIKVRRMTTVEEGIFQETVSRMFQGSSDALNTSAFFDSLNRAIDNCIKSDVSIYELSLIDKIPLFVFISAKTYGDKHDLELSCPVCGDSSEFNIDLSKLDTKIVPEDIEYPKEIELTSFDFPVKMLIQYPVIGDEAIWTDDIMRPVEQFLSLVYSAEGELPDGTKIDEEHYIQIVENLNSDDKKIIKEWMNDFSQYGTNAYVNKKVCNNKECEKYKKIQRVAIPIENIFIKVFV